jgi:DNA (cytosine-5)-methyltransferase 1
LLVTYLREPREQNPEQDLGVGSASPRRTAAPRVSPHHQPRLLTDEEREAFRRISQLSREAKLAALNGDGQQPLHAINVPRLNPNDLMPVRGLNGLRSISLFSGGGGLDLGFDRAGYAHVGSWDILEAGIATIARNRPGWDVHGGEAGDVTQVDWRRYRGEVDVLHGGPPCQPFSVAGRQRGKDDERDMFPEFVRAVKAIRPLAFVAENVAAVGGPKFRPYLESSVLGPLAGQYTIHECELRAEAFGVPQKRRRFVLVGFRRKRDSARWRGVLPTHAAFGSAGSGAVCGGVRWALGLPDIAFDALAPTIRSSLTGPRHTTSILNSVSARLAWEALEIWPNGVAPSRGDARAFVAQNGHFRLSVADVALIQGFPEDWRFEGAVYLSLGQIGNAVPPPLGYALASSVASAIR